MRVIIFTLIFSLASFALADNGKFKDHLMVWSIDIADTPDIDLQQIECQKRAVELSAVLKTIANNLRAPTDKLSLYTQLYLYEPGNITMGSYNVCSLTLLSDTAQFGYRLVKGGVHKGKTSLAQCKTDLDTLKAKPNILVAQLDDSWTLFQGKNCQAYGVEVGQK